METEIKAWCTANKGEHRLQTVQSILMPQRYYYLECGCIYYLDLETNEFKLLRAHKKICRGCGRELDDEMVLFSQTETYCIKCSKGHTGIVDRYIHSQIPKHQNGYVNNWKNDNDEKKRERDAFNEV